MISLSVKRDFFIEISPVHITRKFYLSTHRFFGGITLPHRPLPLYLTVCGD